jgi:alpha-beta hydrolase superfamily lysophospholipase
MIARYLRVASVVLAVSGLAAAASIAIHNYRSMHGLLEADPPSPLLRTPERTGIPGLRTVSFAMSNGIRLAAWYAPPRNRAAVIVTHGTNSDRSTMLPELRVLAHAGYGVLGFDWPGLGDSGGHVRWDGQARAALTRAIDWLSSQPDVDPARIGGLGFSIGAFIMAQVAAQDRRLSAVVLEAPPPDYDDYIRINHGRWGFLSQWPARWALRGSGMLDPAVQPLQLIGRISPRPLLMLAGSRDREIPAASVVKLFGVAREPKTLWVVPIAEHGGYVEVAADAFARRIPAFFGDALPCTQCAPWN